MRSLNRTFGWRRSFAERHQELAAQLRDARRPLAGCRICGSPDLRPLVTINGFPYAECGMCGVVLSAEPPSSESVRALYSAEKQRRTPQAVVYADPGLFDRRVAQIATPKVAHALDVIGRADGRWIDVGCATGELLAAARDAGWDAVGIDSDPIETAFARDRGFTVIDDFVTADHGGEHLRDAAVVSLLNVLEHVEDPSALLSMFAGHLRPGAHLVIEVPRHPSLSSFSNVAFPHLATRHIYAPEHLHVFSERALELLLAAAGLEAISVWTFGQDFQELISSAAVNAGLPEGGLFERMCELVPSVQAAIDAADLSDVLFVVARKG